MGVMTPSAPWRMFRRMQASLLAGASLLYLGAAIHAWRVLPGAGSLKLQRTILWPAALAALSFAAFRLVPALRRGLSRHLWISYRTGFGQSVVSVLAGLGVLVVAAGFIYWQTHAAAHGGRYPAGAFGGYGAGIGLLLAQALIVRDLERDPAFRDGIEGR